jgi:hypothetical protein
VLTESGEPCPIIGNNSQPFCIGKELYRLLPHKISSLITLYFQSLPSDNSYQVTENHYIHHLFKRYSINSTILTKIFYHHSIFLTDLPTHLFFFPFMFLPLTSTLYCEIKSKVIPVTGCGVLYSCEMLSEDPPLSRQSALHASHALLPRNFSF